MKAKYTFTNIALAALMLLSAIIVFFQAQRLLPLIDFTYQLENAYRIFSGQIMYKDFVLVVAPGTYLVMAALMKLFGLSNTVQLIYLMVVSVLTILLTFKIIKQLTHSRVISLIISAPLVFCGHSIAPFPNYDINAIFFILLSIYVLLCTFERKSAYLFFLSGALMALPPLFKQNTGLVYTILTLSSIFLMTVLKQKTISIKQFIVLFSGVLLVSGSFLIWLLLNNVFSDFIYQSFIFPAQMRPLLISIKIVALSYFSFQNQFFFIHFILIALLVFSNWAKKIRKEIMFILLITLIFIARVFNKSLEPNFENAFYIWFDISLLLAYVILNNFSKIVKFNSFPDILPIIAIGVSYASFLSQGVLGSSYGIWPMFFIIVAYIFNYVKNTYKSIDWEKPTMAFILLISISIGITVYKNSRLTFVNARGTLQKATRENLRFVATPGNWISEMEELFNYIDNNIPQDESVFAIPGEDPIYFATQRMPQLNFFQQNSFTCPFTQEQICSEIRKSNINWIIWKTNLQMPSGFANTDVIRTFILREYKLVKVLKGYEIYTR